MSTKPSFDRIGFEDFRRLAKDESLSCYERIGFPDSYREGFETTIFEDILGKLSHLKKVNQLIVDIGPGCSELPRILIQHCLNQHHQLVLIDSREMLGLLPNDPFIKKEEALFPNCPNLLEEHRDKVNVILCYSVLHYALIDTAFFRFLDEALSLLAPGGQLLLGDIPNVSKRKRFFESKAGILFHQKFMRTTELPVVKFHQIEHDKIDDAIIMAIVQRARSQGFNAYILPQNPELPMANRREDILIIRP